MSPERQRPALRIALAERCRRLRHALELAFCERVVGGVVNFQKCQPRGVLGSLSACFLHAGGILAVLKSRDGRILTVEMGEKRKSRTPQKGVTLGAGSWYGDLNPSRTRILRETWSVPQINLLSYYFLVKHAFLK